MGLDMTSFDGALKTHYTADRVENMVYADNPFLALCPKMEDFGGRNLPIPIIYGNPQGRSKTFAKAQTRSTSTNTKVTDFVLVRTKDYSLATIDNETLEASKGDQNAFMDAATTEIDGAINSLTRSLAINLYRGADAAIGQVGSVTTAAGTFVLTLQTTKDVTNFETQQNLVIWSAKTGGTQRVSDGTANTWPVAAVSRSAGTLTLTGTTNGSNTIAAGDYIFVDGDRGLGISGLESWLPPTDPQSGDNFFGVDRSVDPTRLGAWRLDGTSAPIEETLIEADALVAAEGFGIDHYFMNPKKLGDLKKALGTKVQFVDLKAGTNGQISFRGVMIDGDKGPITVVGDQNCPSNRIFGLKLSMVKLYSLGKAVRVIDTDGLAMLRQGSADGVEVRYGYYANFGIRAPGSCINVQV